MGNIIAVNGINGSQLWSMKTRSETFVMNCEDFDVNKDGKKDCIATGRTSQIAAFDPYIGIYDLCLYRKKVYIACLF